MRRRWRARTDEAAPPLASPDTCRAAGRGNSLIGDVFVVGRDIQPLTDRHGLQLDRTPQDESFCTYTIQSGAPLVVPYAFADPRFAASLLVAGDEGFRFYAGAPLISQPGGHRLGARCVLDRDPRPPLGAAQEALLRDLATLAADDMEHRRVTAAGSQVPTARRYAWEQAPENGRPASGRAHATD